MSFKMKKNPLHQAYFYNMSDEADSFSMIQLIF